METIKRKSKTDFPADDWRHYYTSVSAILNDMPQGISAQDVQRKINEKREQEVTTVKRDWHTPELRKNAVQDTTRDGWDDLDCPPES